MLQYGRGEEKGERTVTDPLGSSSKKQEPCLVHVLWCGLARTGHGVTWTGPGVTWTGPSVRWTGHGVTWTGPGVTWTGPGVTWTGSGASWTGLGPCPGSRLPAPLFPLQPLRLGEHLQA